MPRGTERIDDDPLGVEKIFKSPPTKQDLAGRNSSKQIEIFKKITTFFNL